MHLERDILKGKFGKNKQLKKEAREELAEAKSEALEKKKGEKCEHVMIKTHYGYRCPKCGKRKEAKH